MEEKPLISPDQEETVQKVKDACLPPLTFLQSDDQDRRPSLAELQSEDMDRRPSITMYQSVDSQHPDVIAIQKLVERMKFGDNSREKLSDNDEDPKILDLNLDDLQSEDR